MTIDLTGPVPTWVSTCDGCAVEDRLFRLIGTSLALCTRCFEKEHAHH